MTLFLSFRQQLTAGGVKDAEVLDGNGATANPKFRTLTPGELDAQCAGRDIVFAVHGFAVSFQDGAAAFTHLEAALKLPPTAVLVGILWPGDSWVPFVNYPFEGSTANDCGRRLAHFCNKHLSSPSSISFVTHSLGARLALEATARLSQKVRCLCLTAGAINNDALTAQYSDAKKNSEVVYALASRKDWVLELAYPVGDMIALLLNPDHVPFRAALGYAGPALPSNVVNANWQIDDKLDYEHGDYLPPGTPVAKLPVAGAKWVKPAAFIRAALTNSPQVWPT